MALLSFHMWPQKLLLAGKKTRLARFYAASISSKIIAVLGLFALLVVAITTVAAASIGNLAAHERRLNDVSVTTLRVVTHAQEHLTALHQMSFQLNQTDPSGWQDLRNEFDEEAKELQDDLALLKPLMEEDDKAEFEIVQNSVDQYLAAATKARAALTAGDVVAASRIIQSSGVAIFEVGDKAFDTLVDDENAELADETQATQEHATTSVALMIFFGVAGLCAICFLALVIVRREITRPLGFVTTALNRLSEGDETADVQATHRRDEVGQLSRAFRAFRRASLDYRRDQEGARRQLEEARADAEKARATAEAANAAKSAFLANMSHEIRTPLNGILGMAQVLEMGTLTEEQAEQVSTIVESGRTLTTVLNDVLDLSKIEAGKLAVNPTNADLKGLLTRVRKFWLPRAVEKNIELQLSIDSEMPTWLELDPVRVQQCLSNLVSNAIKFTEKGEVRISARSRSIGLDEHLIEIRVSDSGIGISEETLARLFQPFIQADESSTRQFGGTGLGLSITRRLAQIMGGDATATSMQGQGSEFTLTFRARARESVAHDDPSAKSNPAHDVRETIRASSLRILLVDDNAINRQVASLFLKPLKVKIVEAANGQQALEALGAQAFDVVLLDMHMPVMDGPTTIREIRRGGKPWAGIHVIALTADAMSGDRERYLGMGMDGYLAKPLSERDLLSEIVRVRAEARSPDQLAS